MMLDGVCFLAAYTSRSLAYASALSDANLEPQYTVLFGGAEGVQLGQQTESVKRLELAVADFHSTVHRIPAGDVNDPAVVRTVVACAPRLIIYAGYGGQIVHEELLGIGAPLLHLHAGWLPDYRGSTTTYYSILNEHRCGVSAILLSPHIDQGLIVAQRWYPTPVDGTEIDHGYDARIRSDLLVDVVREWHVSGGFSTAFEQRPERGRMYYIIHPVLKHLAILSLHAPEETARL